MNQQMEAVLQQMLSGQNDQIKAAEQMMQGALAKDPTATVTALAGVLSTSATPAIRQLASNQLRLALVPAQSVGESVWPKLAPNVQSGLKTGLLDVIVREADSKVRNLIVYLVTDLAAFLATSGAGGWPELFPACFRFAGSAVETERQCGFALFGQLAIALRSETFRPHFNVIYEALRRGLQDPSIPVRIEALSATSAFLQIMERGDKHVVGQFAELLPPMLEVLRTVIGTNEDEAMSVLQTLAEIAEAQDFFFRKHVQTLCSTLFPIINSNGLSDETRATALEVIITLCECRAGLMKKINGFTGALLDTLFAWMITIEDDEDWYKFDDDDADHLYPIAEEALDRLSNAFHGQVLVPALFSRINTLLASPDWRHRYAAVMAISICIEGCQKVLKKNVSELAKNLAAIRCDQHPRVRWACASALGQMCNHFAPKFQRLHHEAIVSLLVSGAKDACPRVVGNYVAAFVDFADSAGETLKPHAHTLLETLGGVIVSPNIHVSIQENAISAISALVEAMGADFKAYYPQFAPFLLNIIQCATAKEQRLLRGRALECITLIGLQMGKEAFANDARIVMEKMITTTTTEDDDPQNQFLESSYARIAEILGNDFVPYLQYVMPSALQRAKIKVDVKVFNNVDEAPTEGWETINLGEKVVSIHTAILEEKASAMNTLASYALNIGAGFFPYVEAVTEVAIDSLTFMYNEDVRISAYTALPFLLKGVVATLPTAPENRNVLTAMWQRIFNGVIAALQQEDDFDVKIVALRTFAQCFLNINEPCLGQEQLVKVTTLLRDMLEEWLQQSEALSSHRTDEDYDEEEGETLDDAEEYFYGVLESICDCIGALARVFKDGFGVYFHELLLPSVTKMLQANETIIHKAICIFDDFIEASTALASAYKDLFIPRMIAYARNPKNPTLRQSSVYGLGIAAISLDAAIAPQLGEIVAVLQGVVSEKDARSEDNLCCTENAVSSLMKIACKYDTAPGMQTMICQLLALLPLVEDEVEAIAVNTLLVEMLEKKGVQFFGSPENILRILQVFASQVETECFNAEMHARAAAVIRTMSMNIPSAMLGTLTPELTQKLQAFVAKYP